MGDVCELIMVLVKGAWCVISNLSMVRLSGSHVMVGKGLEAFAIG